MTEQLDSLQAAYEQRDAEYNELNEYLGVIATGMDSIALQEGQILKSDESPALSREQIKKNLDAYKQTLENQREPNIRPDLLWISEFILRKESHTVTFLQVTMHG